MFEGHAVGRIAPMCNAEAPARLWGRGVWRIDSAVEAMACMTAPKNVDLFESLKIFSKEECEARAEVWWPQ